MSVFPASSGQLARASHPRTGQSAQVSNLVDRARAGDAEAFAQLYVRYHGWIQSSIRFETRSDALAEDLTAETFERALRRIHQFRQDSRHFAAWLRRISRNLVIDHYRSSQARHEWVTDDVATDHLLVEDVAAVVLRDLSDERVRRALLLLAPTQRRCLALRFLDQRTIKETAEALDCSQGAVKQLQLRALRNLADLIPLDDHEELAS
jgi:RNA polymerase sigma-70 factor (ECF subfamily)